MKASSEIAIRVNNLSKEFRLYSHPSDLLFEMLRGKPRYRSFWALRDITFDVLRGQVVGLIGRNGAGKSTLLKIITGTLDKTSGDVEVKGRVSSILELGTGFSGEYTGRENIYLGGLMVGLSHNEIMAKEDWIIEFSELADFIDQPFKTYSTGMQARLTFATAVCVDPDILIVDEALSVGDARFQRKSFGKIEQFRRSGRTILLVSHDINTISTFCDHAILLDRGQIYEQGKPERISKIYYKMLFESTPAENTQDEEQSDEILEGEATELQLDPARLIRERGQAWKINLSDEGLNGDSLEDLRRSKYLLFENDLQLKPAHTSHKQIRDHGNGAYSHWGTNLYFSTSDNSDPRRNGRTYTLRHNKLVVKRQPAEDKPGQHRVALRQAALQRLGLNDSPLSASSRELRVGNQRAEIIDFCILQENGERVLILTSGLKYTIQMRVLFYEDVKSISAGFLIRDRKGVDVFGTSTFSHKLNIPPARRGDVIELNLDVTMWLTNGVYFLTFSTGDPDSAGGTKYDMRYDGLQFEIRYKPNIFTTSIVDLDEKISFSSRNLLEAEQK